APSLTPVERRAFRELSRRLTARLTDAGVEYKAGDQSLANDMAPDPTLSDLAQAAKAASEPLPEPSPPPPSAELAQPSSLPEPMPAAAAPVSILDRLPVGVLVYRHSELLYANRAFL